MNRFAASFCVVAVIATAAKAEEAPDARARIKNIIVEFDGKEIDDFTADSKNAKFQMQVAEDLKEIAKKLEWEKAVAVSTWFTTINGAAIQIGQGNVKEYKTLIEKVRSLPYVRKADFDGRVR